MNPASGVKVFNSSDSDVNSKILAVYVLCQTYIRPSYPWSLTWLQELSEGFDPYYEKDGVTSSYG